MSSFGIYTLVLIISLETSYAWRINSPIVGGTKCNISEFPFMAQLRNEDMFHSHRCGCTILNELWILTAAHCVYQTKKDEFDIHYSFTNIGTNLHNIVGVDEIVIHEKYIHATFTNDIALLKLVAPIPLSKCAKTVKLMDKPLGKITSATVVGWGVTQAGGDASQFLQKVDIQIFPKSVCKQRYGERFKDTQICGGHAKGGKDACQGDSGGPLIANGVQIGIVSWGKGCADSESPGVYTEVASFLDWTTDKIAKFSWTKKA